MKPIRPVLLAALLCAAVGAGLPSDQSNDLQAEMALQAAIKTETVEGNLKSAIAQYLKLADGSHHAVAAKALVRLGRCYEMLGDEQARKAYDRVIRDFPDQMEMVAAAKARLAALRRPAAVPSLAVRRVWAGPDVNTEGVPSRDGRFLSFTNRGARTIALRDLATGVSRDLMKNSDVRQKPASRSLISPDGKQVAYSWAAEDGSLDIRLIGIDGTGSRVLHRGERLASIELCAWSPDGSLIVAIFAGQDEKSGIEANQIALISTADGSARILKMLGSRESESCDFSPDGRLIACNYPPGEDSDSRDIFLLAADGNRETLLVEHPADDQLLGWSPDGSGILFASDRAGQWGVWFVRVAYDRPVGRPIPIQPELGPLEPLGFVRSGSYYYGLESGGTEALVVELDSTASRITAAPALINERFAGRNRLPLFSPDGRSLAYFSNRTANRWLLCVRSLSAGEDREFLVPQDLERLRIARWTPGGQGILISGFDRQRHHMGFYAMDVRTGETRAILSSNPEADTLDGQWAADGKSLYLARAGFAFADEASRIMQRDSATGLEKEILRLTPGEDVTNLALSPDGLELAFTARSRKGSGSLDRLGIVSAQGEHTRELLRLSRRETIRRDGLVWTPDGRSLLFAKAVETSKDAFRLELWRASPQDQEAHNVGVLASDMAFGDGSAGLSVHPDGKSVAFQAGRRNPEVWVMENVLPVTKVDPPPEFLEEVTLEAWIKFSSLGPEFQTIASKGNSDYDGVSCVLNLDREGRLRWGIRHSHTYFGEAGDWSIEGIIGDTTLRPNTWYYVAGTVYSSRSASLYLNGALMKMGAITQTIPARPTEPLHIGLSMYYGEPSSRFNGSIDAVAFHERALSAEEIRQRYLVGLPRHRS